MIISFFPLYVINVLVHTGERLIVWYIITTRFFYILKRWTNLHWKIAEVLPDILKRSAFRVTFLQTKSKFWKPLTLPKSVTVIFGRSFDVIVQSLYMALHRLISESSETCLEKQKQWKRAHKLLLLLESEYLVNVFHFGYSVPNIYNVTPQAGERVPFLFLKTGTLFPSKKEITLCGLQT